MKRGIRIASGFIVGTIAYVVGFLVGGIVTDLVVGFAFFVPKTIDLSQAGITGAAMGSNLLAGAAFIWITKEEKSISFVAFNIYLICLATVYLVLALLGGDWHLLWYPGLSFILNGWSIKEAFTPEQEEKETTMEGKEPPTEDQK